MKLVINHDENHITYLDGGWVRRVLITNGVADTQESFTPQPCEVTENEVRLLGITDLDEQCQ